jgi:hypothetical protein
MCVWCLRGWVREERELHDIPLLNPLPSRSGEASGVGRYELGAIANRIRSHVMGFASVPCQTEMDDTRDPPGEDLADRAGERSQPPT